MPYGKYHIFDNVESFTLGNIRFNPYEKNQPIVSSYSWGLLPNSRLGNKFVCIADDPNDSVPSEFIRRRARYSPVANDVFFISPQCKVNRTMYRKSKGYTITRSKEKATKIIIPDPWAIKMNRNLYPIVEANFYAYSNGDLCAYIVDRCKDTRNLQPDDLEKDIDAIKAYFEKHKLFNDNFTFVYNNKLSILPSQVLLNCEEYKDILSGKFGNYCIESCVPLDFATIITPEQLLLWENEVTREMLVGAILASDWRKYPFTLRKFLMYNNRCWTDKKSEEWRYFLRAIDYNDDNYSENLFEIINPEDWNMYQDYLLLSLGVSEKGGFINVTTSHNKHKYLRHKLAIAPLKIDKPMMLKSIYTILQNQ